MFGISFYFSDAKLALFFYSCFLTVGMLYLQNTQKDFFSNKIRIFVANLRFLYSNKFA